MSQETTQTPPTTPQAEQELHPSPKEVQSKPRSPRKPKSQLTPKQALFVKGYTDRKSPTFGNAYQSAVAAGYAPEYAEKILAVLSENVRATMAEALDQAGATDEILAQRHMELLNKREVHVTKTRDGEEAELIDQPDTNAVKAALDMAYKLKRHYPAERFEHDLPPGTVIFTRSQDGGHKQPKDPAQASSG